MIERDETLPSVTPLLSARAERRVATTLDIWPVPIFRASPYFRNMARSKFHPTDAAGQANNRDARQMPRNQVNTPSQKIVMGSASRSGKRFFMDLNIHPRRHLVHRAMTNFILPIAAITMISTVIFFPSPNDFNAAVATVTSPWRAEAIQQAKDSSDAAFIVEDYAQSVPGLTQQLEANADCFVGLDAATAQRLQECAPAVTSIIAQIVQYQDNPVVARALETGGDGKLLPQIRMAAAEVCRSLWSTGQQVDAYFDDPACQMAQVTLAPRQQLR